jgi:hypothetical protein
VRDFLDAILSFIGAASLSDDEYASIDLDTQAYNVETYEALLTILDAREQVSNLRDRLRYYFLARDVAVSDAAAASSKILIGDVLCS